MLEQVNVYYEGWGERWQWGTLMYTTALTGRPQVVFEFSHDARQKGLELCDYQAGAKSPFLQVGDESATAKRS